MVESTAYELSKQTRNSEAIFDRKRGEGWQGRRLGGRRLAGWEAEGPGGLEGLRELAGLEVGVLGW